MKIMSLITTSLVLMTSGASDVEARGEKLNYTVKVLNAEFAHATLVSKDSKVYGEIKTNEKWSSVFLMDNKIASKLNEQSFPIETELVLCSKRKSSAYDIKFNDKQLNVVKSSGGRETRKSKRLSTRTHDLTSWLYHARKELSTAPDTLMSFKLFSGNKTYDVNLVPLPEETISTPIGSKVSKPYTIIVTRPIRYKKKMKIWFELDESFTPLRITGSAKLGKFEIMIDSIEQSTCGEENCTPTKK